MKRSTNRILTTHAGSLTRPDDLIELYRMNAPRDTLEPRLNSAVAEVVRPQAEAGIDVVNDGEFGKPMRQAIDFGAWGQYMFDLEAGGRIKFADQFVRRRRRRELHRLRGQRVAAARPDLLQQRHHHGDADGFGYLHVHDSGT